MFFELWIAGAPWSRAYAWGFWCGDLLCLRPIPQRSLTHEQWEKKREQYLSPIASNPVSAFLKWVMKCLAIW